MAGDTRYATLSTSDGKVIARRVRIADSFVERLLGLMGRSNLGHDDGLYLPGTNGIHMLFMRMSIDCLLLGGEANGTYPVLALRQRLRPWVGIVWYVRGARGAVELPAGSLARAGLATGDFVRLVPSRQPN